MRFKKLEEPKGSADYVQLKNDKDFVIGVLAGEPYDFYCVWENKKPREVHSSDPNGRFRFRVNIVVKEGPTFTPKILENGVVLYRKLEELSEEYDLAATYVKIIRNGTGMDTEYSAIPSQKMKLSPEELSHIKTLKLHDLSGKKDAATQSPAPFDSDEEIPF